MAQIIHNTSLPNDGLGDELRTAMNNQNTMNTELYTTKVDKVTGKELSSNDFTNAHVNKLDGIEPGAEVNVQADWTQLDPDEDDFIKNKPEQLFSSVGYFHHQDTLTATTPLTLVTDVEKKITNNQLGAQTNIAQAPYGVANIFNSTTNEFDFSTLTIGDTLNIRVDLLLTTTSVNQKYSVFLRIGEGTAYEYDLLVFNGQIKAIETDYRILGEVGFSLDYSEHITAPTTLYILSDDDGSVKVNGFYTHIIRKGVNLVSINPDRSLADALLIGGRVAGIFDTPDTDYVFERESDVNSYIVSKQNNNFVLNAGEFLTGDELLFSLYDLSATASVLVKPQANVFINGANDDLVLKKGETASLWLYDVDEADEYWIYRVIGTATVSAEKKYRVLLSQQNVNLYSGTLEVGKRYIIKTYNAGDDFTNVGGTNEEGSDFVATDTTPTDWSNGSELLDTEASVPIEYQRRENTMGFEPEWQYTPSGTYGFAMPGVDLDKVDCFMGSSSNFDQAKFRTALDQDYQFTLYSLDFAGGTFVKTDDLLFKTELTIIINP